MSCEATLSDGRECGFRGRHEVEGRRLCGTHRRAHVRATVGVCECPVCLDVVKTPASLFETACGHRFHARCARAWFARRPLTCPMCRATCLEGMALLGPRLAPQLEGLLRTVPPPPRAFFPAYIVARLESEDVVRALGADKTLIELLVDLACECFTRDNFFAKVRGLGL